MPVRTITVREHRITVSVRRITVREYRIKARENRLAVPVRRIMVLVRRNQVLVRATKVLVHTTDVPVHTSEVLVRKDCGVSPHFRGAGSHDRGLRYRNGVTEHLSPSPLPLGHLLCQSEIRDSKSKADPAY